MERGVVFDIKKFSVHDGPGIRTTVFLKGCPLRCAWCHNPESQRAAPDLLLRPTRCIGCGACGAACPEGAIARSDGRLVTDRARCVGCGACVAVCYAEARERVGREMTVAAVLDVVERDRPFYEASGGGVTFSGGEPLQQPDFLRALLRASQARGLHTVVDTCGHAPWSVLDGLRPLVDLFLYDVKVLDDDRHRALTGVSNARLLENLRTLAERGQALIVRTPLIPGVNDAPDELRQLGELVAALPGVHRLDLLPYHAIAQDKYRRLGRTYALPDLQPPDERALQTAVEILQSCGLEVTQGG